MTDIVERLREGIEACQARGQCRVHNVQSGCECAEVADEIERLRALVEDALRGLHNDFEPDNQSVMYYRIKRALEQQS